ncbi:MAG: chloride channel protein, partial [Spirochaetaceae bacterium]|nr:chloride channel protein [Spirochaetaceae bacterium]
MGNRGLSADRRELIKSLNYLGSWCLIAIVSGTLGVLLTGGFLFALDKALNGWVNMGRHIILVAVSGALIAALISRIEPESRGEGIPSYIRGVEENGGYLPFKATIVKLFSSLATLATWGNGGIVGPIGRVTAGFASTLVGTIRPERSNFALRRTAAICGMASV